MMKNQFTFSTRNRTITSISELEAINILRRLLPSPPVKLELIGLSESRNKYWQLTFNRYMRACGCKEGGIFAWIFVGVYIANLLLYPSFSSMSGWTKFGVGCGIAFGGALTGKILGLLYSEILFRKDVKKLRVEMESISIGVTQKTPGI